LGLRRFFVSSADDGEGRLRREARAARGGLLPAPPPFLSRPSVQFIFFRRQGKKNERGPRARTAPTTTKNERRMTTTKRRHGDDDDDDDDKALLPLRPGPAQISFFFFLAFAGIHHQTGPSLDGPAPALFFSPGARRQRAKKRSTTAAAAPKTRRSLFSPLLPPSAVALRERKRQKKHNKQAHTHTDQPHTQTSK
jgi:hypothetical protein